MQGQFSRMTRGRSSPDQFRSGPTRGQTRIRSSDRRLEQQGVKEYCFLKGGSEGYYEAKFGKLNFKVPGQG